MNTLSTLINAIAFTALFVAYEGGSHSDRPSGVRRALQTYAGQGSSGAFPVTGFLWSDSRPCERSDRSPECPELAARTNEMDEIRQPTDYAASLLQLAPPASVSRNASPQAFASVRTRKI
ncbi:hypothetical protein ILFOPFJJ_02305 [Ensifer psoraleae]|nr:hypothetical protein [Sinorhizobium psoraleae]